LTLNPDGSFTYVRDSGFTGQDASDRLFFASVDKSDLQPTVHRPKMARYYNEAGLVFVPNFVLPEPFSTAQ
jgi:hypothetical protein